jgi:uncharacterized damage-inducible protein DinB
MTGKEAILHNLRTNAGLVARFTDDLDHGQLHHRVVPAANCAGWILGHLVLSERRMMTLLGLPDEDLPGPPFDDLAERFSRDQAATTRTDYGDVGRLPASFQAHRSALIDRLESADEAVLDRPLPEPMPIASTVGELLLFMPVHVATHLGQISTIRRSLGLPPIV